MSTFSVFIDNPAKILSQALSQGGEFAELYLEQRLQTSITCEDNKIEEVISGQDTGAGLRLIHDLRTSYAYTNNISETELMRLADDLRMSVDKPAVSPVTVNRSEAKTYAPWDDPQGVDKIPAPRKVELVKMANGLVRGVDRRIVQVRVVYMDLVQRVQIVNSQGLDCRDERLSTVFLVEVVAAENGLIQSGREVLGGSKGYNIFDEPKISQAALTAANRALMMLGAKPAPSGKMTVVLSGKAGGTMVHEAIGHGLEADLTQNKLSVYADRVGQPVASPLITVIDDATLPGYRGSFNFDDEGTPARRKVLVDKGILTGYMYDMLTGMKDGQPSTGNGRRQNYQHQPIPRMTNTLIAPGQDDPQAILRSVKKGVLVTSLGGGQVNTVNGDFVFEINEGYLIENGEATYPVRGATLSGNGPEILSQVEAVGNDLGFTIGTCGKDGQLAPVSDAQPTLLIPQIVVGGTA